MSTNHQVFLFLVEENGMEVLKEANGIAGQPLPDNTTEVLPGDTIEWVLGPDSGISSIDSITAGAGLTFTPTPALWTYVVTGSLSTTPHSYTVNVTPSGGGGSIPHDPKIKVNATTY